VLLGLDHSSQAKPSWKLFLWEAYHLDIMVRQYPPGVAEGVHDHSPSKSVSISEPVPEPLTLTLKTETARSSEMSVPT
jgi:hypothetical protein